MNINIFDEQEIYKIDYDKTEKIVKSVILSETDDGEYGLNILICDNERIKEFNENYRHKTGPTDVLSFEYGLNEEIIGDIVVSVESVAKQAPDFGNTFEDEFFYILIHGILHILGYTHEDSEENQKIMYEKQDLYFQKFYKEG